jgi:nicotinamidase-related amidase
MLLNIENTLLTLIDVQDKLTAVMHHREDLIKNIVRLIKGMQLLGIPIIRLEQNPSKMGRTIPEIDHLLTAEPPIEKMTFSCCGSDAYMKALTATGRQQVLIAGIETHVCVYQTAQELSSKGYRVEVVADATSSRNPINRDTALAKITSSPAPDNTGSACITTTEMLLFELVQTAEHPHFREMLKIVK